MTCTIHPSLLKRLLRLTRYQIRSAFVPTMMRVAELGPGRVKYGAEKWRGSIRSLIDSAELTALESEGLTDLGRGSTADLILAEGSSSFGNRNPFGKVYARRTKFSSSEIQRERTYLPIDLKSNSVESKATPDAGKDSPTYTTEQVLT